MPVKYPNFSESNLARESLEDQGDLAMDNEEPSDYEAGPANDLDRTPSSASLIGRSEEGTTSTVPDDAPISFPPSPSLSTISTLAESSNLDEDCPPHPLPGEDADFLSSQDLATAIDGGATSFVGPDPAVSEMVKRCIVQCLNRSLILADANKVEGTSLEGSDQTAAPQKHHGRPRGTEETSTTVDSFSGVCETSRVPPFLRGMFADILSPITNRMAALTASFDHLNSSIGTIKTSLTKVLGDVSVLERRVAILENTVTQVNTREIPVLRTEAAEARRDVENLQVLLEGALSVGVVGRSATPAGTARGSRSIRDPPLSLGVVSSSVQNLRAQLAWVGFDDNGIQSWVWDVGVCHVAPHWVTSLRVKGHKVIHLCVGAQQAIELKIGKFKERGGYRDGLVAPLGNFNWEDSMKTAKIQTFLNDNANEMYR
ncbi:hypothetical protein M427DRAFT_28855 [Gonapodya prolifera JEL478]|uniref:Uncharacterized protein n=1 Tax=Gonapodya prolifera (strain JEL478) TaxID=1344416 RepID=A0A139ARU8_GONPJ|nr:hypothetical protein M427DRAFT_28855 [Gonapodya prolifera JEL478]|eukprot:KXS19384.1 hypothetical protein M427DRAFT_28855 [Gonapodya prolifera JEL478]